MPALTTTDQATILFDPHGRSKEGFLECKFRVNNALLSSQKVEKILLVIVADRSGSMAGRPWQQVQESLITIMNETYALDHIKTHVVVYNDKAETLKLNKSDFERQINAIKASSLTCFSSAFENTLRIIKRGGSSCDRVVCVVMTDGVDTSKTNPEGAREDFARKLKSLTIPSSVHVIGFSSGHNYKYLDKVRQCGSQPGVFRYAEASDGRDALRGKFEEVFDWVASKPTTIEVFPDANATFQWTDETKKFASLDQNIRDDNVTLATFSGWVRWDQVFPADEPSEVGRLRFNIWTHTGSEVVFSVPLIVQPAQGKAGQASLRIRLLRRDVDHLAETVGDDSKGHDRFLEAIPAVSELQETCKRFDPFGKGIPTSLRQDLLETRHEVQTQLDALHTLIADAMHSHAGSHSSAVLARAADIRFQGKFTKARRQRKINQRVAKNITTQEGIEDALEALPDLDPSAVNFDDEALDFFQCTLSQGSIKEILLEEKVDILGFGLAVKRPEEIIDCPTLIRIFEISTTLVSHSTMTDAIKYSISVDGHLRTHGGFEVQADLGSAVRGRSREPINEFLPLYINDDHWSRVRLLIPPILGRFTCLDALAYDEQQLHVFFLVLGSMAFRICRNAAGEREGRLLFAFARTCRQLTIDFDLQTKIRDKVKEFCESAAGRTKNKVQNLTTLIGYVMVVDDDIWDEIDWNQFWSAFLIETVRRSAGVVLKGRSLATVLEIQNRLLYGADSGDQPPTAAALEEMVNDTSPIKENQDGEDEAFQGWVYSNDLDNPGDVDQLVQQMNIPDRKVLKGLAAYGKAVAERLPGPNIVQKTAKATSAADAWWQSLLPTKDSLEEFALPTQTLQPRIVTAGVLQTMKEIEEQVSRVTFPSFPSILSAARCTSVFNNIRASCKEAATSIWSTLDQNSGLCPTPWLDQLSSARKNDLPDRHTISLAGLIKELVQPEDLILYKRAMFLLAVEYHSNKRARTAANQGLFPDIGVDAECSAKVLKTHHKLFEEKQSQRQDSIAEYTRWQRSNTLLVNTDDIWVFIGCLARSITERGQAFSDLVGMLQDPSSVIPLQKQKVRIILSGSYDDQIVFLKGNIWIPDKNHREAFVNAIGFDAYNEIEMSMRSSSRLHVYRDSDIPNRHGHCNSNPHRPAYCRKCIAAGLGAARQWNG